MSIIRRSFIKKLFVGGLFTTTGLKNFSCASSNTEEAVNQELKPYLINGAVEWEELRKQFPLTQDRYYFNNATIGPSPLLVIEAINDLMQKLAVRGELGNSLYNSVHEKIAEFLVVNNDSIALTRNTTEGMNIVARGLGLKQGDEVILTNHEHVGGAAPWFDLRDRIGVKIKLVDLNSDGKDNIKLFEENITSETKVISFSHITCTTGLVLPVKEIVNLCKSKDIISCVDGAQAIGMIPVNIEDTDPDFYVTSGHKWLLGPKGTGVLYIKEDLKHRLLPAYVGAHALKSFDINSTRLDYNMHTNRLEYGTRNTPITMGLASAMEFINGIGIQNIQERGMALATYLKKELVKNNKVQMLSPMDPDFSSSIVTFKIDGINYEEAKQILLKKHKCRTRGIYENNIDGIRVSCAIYNSFEEMDKLIAAVKTISENY